MRVKNSGSVDSALFYSVRTVGAALRGRPAWNSVPGVLPRSSSAPGGHGGPPLQ